MSLKDFLQLYDDIYDVDIRDMMCSDVTSEAIRVYKGDTLSIDGKFDKKFFDKEVIKFRPAWSDEPSIVVYVR